MLDLISDFDVYFFEVRDLGSSEPRADEAARVVLNLFHRGLVDIKREKPRRRRRRHGRELSAGDAEEAILDPENWREPKSDWFMVSATKKGHEALARAFQERQADLED